MKKITPRIKMKSTIARFFTEPIAKMLIFFRLNANLITFLGTVICITSAYFVTEGKFITAGLIFFGGSILDLFDGAVARLSGTASRFGAYFDSLMDRIGESVLLMGLLIYCTRNGDDFGAYLTFGTLAISLLVSYSRARAEGIKVEGDVGLLGRPERVIVLTLGLLTGLYAYALDIIIDLGALTIAQRFFHVWRATRD